MQLGVNGSLILKIKHWARALISLSLCTQPAGDINHKPCSRLPWLFTRLVVICPAAQHSLVWTKLCCSVTEACVYVNNLLTLALLGMWRSQLKSALSDMDFTFNVHMDSNVDMDLLRLLLANSVTKRA